MTILYLVRHGESLANAGHRTSDPAQIALTERGHRQAENIVPLLLAAEPTLIVTSSYLRTKETSQPLLNQIPHVFHEEWPVHEFTYLSPNRCENMTSEERSPLVQQYWDRCDPFYVDGPGAESWANLVQRTINIRQHLEQYSEKEKIIVFAHGQFIQMFLTLLIGMPSITSDSMRQWRKWMKLRPIENTEIIEQCYTEHNRWQIQNVSLPFMLQSV